MIIPQTKFETKMIRKSNQELEEYLAGRGYALPVKMQDKISRLRELSGMKGHMRIAFVAALLLERLLGDGSNGGDNGSGAEAKLELERDHRPDDGSDGSRKDSIDDFLDDVKREEDRHAERVQTDPEYCMAYIKSWGPKYGIFLHDGMSDDEILSILEFALAMGLPWHLKVAVEAAIRAIRKKKKDDDDFAAAVGSLSVSTACWA